jgi:hypothetical protein
MASPVKLGTLCVHFCVPTLLCLCHRGLPGKTAAVFRGHVNIATAKVGASCVIKRQHVTVVAGARRSDNPSALNRCSTMFRLRSYVGVKGIPCDNRSNEWTIREIGSTLWNTRPKLLHGLTATLQCARYAFVCSPEVLVYRFAN